MTEERAPYGTPSADAEFKRVVRYLNQELDLATVGGLSNSDLKSFERTLYRWHSLTEQLVKARLAGQAVQFAEGQGHD